jgi:hypothetical protein
MQDLEHDRLIGASLRERTRFIWCCRAAQEKPPGMSQSHAVFVEGGAARKGRGAALVIISVSQRRPEKRGRQVPGTIVDVVLRVKG